MLLVRVRSAPETLIGFKNLDTAAWPWQTTTALVGFPARAHTPWTGFFQSAASVGRRLFYKRFHSQFTEELCGCVFMFCGAVWPCWLGVGDAGFATSAPAFHHLVPRHHRCGCESERDEETATRSCLSCACRLFSRRSCLRQTMSAPHLLRVSSPPFALAPSS